MRRTLKRTSFLGLPSRAYRCRVERLESRSMMAADVADAAADALSDDAAAKVSADTGSIDEWQAYAPAVCELQTYDGADPLFVDPVTVDDASLMVFEPVDIRVQFVSSETEPGWAAYYYTVGADGVVQGVSVVASYDEPTIAAFVTEHADDPAVQISDYGDGWWIDGFPLELAPSVPEQTVFYGGDETGSFGYVDTGFGDGSGSLNVFGDWSWDGCCGVCTCDESGVIYTSYWSGDDWTGGWYDAGGYAGDDTVIPLFYARGADLSEPVAQDAFGTSSMPNDADVAAAPAEERDVAVAVPATVNPRSAAFADMSMMAAVAAAARAHAEDAPVVGGGRRRR